MKIEDITISKIKQISDSRLFSLRLRAIQLYEKYAEIEKKEQLVGVDWDSFFKRYRFLIEEFDRRDLSYTKHPMDKVLEKAKKFLIKILGTYAQMYSPLGKHFSLLIQVGDTNILVDPAVTKGQVGEDIHYIIVTQTDKDHWGYLKQFKKVPIYSTGGVLDRLPFEEKHLFLKPLKIGKDGVTIHPIKTTHKVGVPSIGLRIDRGDTKISVLPEFLNLGKAQKDLVEKTVWICGVGNYEEDDDKAGKLSFLSLMKLADELKPKKIFLTNLRKELLGHKNEVETELTKRQGRILYDGDVLGEDEIIKGLKWGLNKPAYRIFLLEDLEKTPHFDKGKAVVEVKFDGMRTRVEKKGKDITIMSDPEDIKGSPIKTKRLPWQEEELKGFKDDFVGDTEVIMIDKEKNECLHRTVTNSLLNGKFDPTEMSKKAHIFIFDLIELNGKDIRSWPLKERKEVLAKFEDTEHIHFVKPTTNLNKSALSYVVDLEKRDEVKKALDKIMESAHHKDKFFPKFIAEGVMLKLFIAPYEVPVSHSMVKWKEKYEVDALVVGEHQIVQEGKKLKVWNYSLACGPIKEEWAEAIKKMDKKAVIEFKGKLYNYIGKTDNTKEDVAIGSILRVASEDINKYETADPKYPYYRAYVSVVMQPVPEKDVPDKMFVLERLSEFTPRRETLIEKAVKDDVKASIKEGKMPKEIYEKYAKENEPLPKEFYNDPREGEAFFQTHIRGLEPDDVEAYKKGKLSMAKLFEGHSIHVDDRMNLGLPKLIQWVITDNDVESYLNMLEGKLVETVSGVKNVAKSFALIKPSAEEPQEVKKIEIRKPEVTENYIRIPVSDCEVTATITISEEKGIKALYCGKENKIRTYLFDINKWTVVRAEKWVEEQGIKKLIVEKAEIKEPSISTKGAKLLEKIQIKKESYFIPPGDVGTTAYKYAWMGLIWRGKVKTGVGRQDFHEYFYYPDTNLPAENKKLANGKFVFRAFEREKGAGNFWQVWKATENLPTDPILHKDSGYHYLVKAEDLKAIGGEHYTYGRKEPK